MSISTQRGVSATTDRTPHPLVTALGYLVVRGPVGPWRDFAGGVLGAQVVDGDNPAEVAVRTDDNAYRLVVEDGPPGPDSLVALGFQTVDDAGLDALVERVGAAGVEVVEDPELARRRGVARLVRFTDVAGHRVEAHHTPAPADEPFVSPRGVRFVAGDLGVGHAFMVVEDAARTATWYQEVLGFRLSDTIAFGPTDAVFLHCNARHHTIAFAQLPIPAGIGHLMLEVESLRMVGESMDAAQSGPDPLFMSIGEHTNDLMTSFYVITPSGFQIEYGFDGLLVDDATWSVGHHDKASIWGHQFMAAPGGPPPGPGTPAHTEEVGDHA